MEEACVAMQIPSAEEMRREVANITCQLQSVYLKDQPELSHENINEVPTNTGENCLTEHKDSTSSGSNDEKVIDPWAPLPSNSCMISALPREEKITEEFEINGKLYKQTYTRKVVIEKKTTRDVFLLPASNIERGKKHPTKNGDVDENKLNPASHSDTRPILDLTVVCNGNTADQVNETSDVCFKPAVILCPSTSVTKHVSDCQAAKQTRTNRITNTTDSNCNKPVVQSNTRMENTSPKRFRNRYSMKDVTDALGRHLRSTIRRTKSVINSRDHVPEIEFAQNGAQNTLQNDNTAENKNESMNSEDNQLIGYMYQFGTWDNSAPVLDPRLPVSLCSRPSPSNSGRLGIVTANPAEWHLAEMGPEASQDIQAPLIRGRIVACLQRFTQNSAISGRDLHRSTFVQQTRLLRQRNQKEDGESKLINDVSESNQICVKSDDDDDDDDDNGLGAEHSREINTPLAVQIPKADTIGSDWIPGGSDIIPCSEERLQLLQSCCPTAAAAVILLGRQFDNRNSNCLDNEMEMDGLNDLSDFAERKITNGRVFVNAKSWCPHALYSEDISDYLLLHQDVMEGSPHRAMRKDSTNNVPHMKIRGGTLDGLIRYALNIFKSGPQDLNTDRIFPEVFLTTYPTFTTADELVEKLIQTYVAFSPIEPGCQSLDWSDALNIVQFLINIIKLIPAEKWTIRLILLMARFNRLLNVDAKNCKSLNIHSAEADKGGGSYDSLDEQNGTSQMNGLQTLSNILSKYVPIKTLSGQYDRLSTRNNSVLTERNTYDVKKSNVVYGSQSNKNSVDTNAHISMTFIKAADMKSVENKRVNDAVNRTSQFLTANSKLVAREITRDEEDLFSQIKLPELLDIRGLEHGGAPSLSKCVDHFNRLVRWAQSMILVSGQKLGEQMALHAFDDDKVGDAQSDHNSIHRRSSDTPSRITAQYRADKLSSKRHSDKNLITACLGVHETPGIEQTIREKHLTIINKIVVKFCEILKHLKQLKNFSSFLAILLVLQGIPTNLLSKKSRSMLSAFQSYMRPPMFAEYRKDLEEAALPYLPYLGLMFQQLIHLHAGNTIFLSADRIDSPALNKKKILEDTRNSGSPQLPSGTALNVMQNICFPKEQFINVWRCWKHYLVLSYFIQRNQIGLQGRHIIAENKEISLILNKYQDCFSDEVLNEMKDELLGKVRDKKTW